MIPPCDDARALVTLAALLVPALLRCRRPTTTETPLSVLFLGDQGHHRPADRAAQLIPVFHDRGIEVTYTEDVADLNPTNLAKYDALIVYANIDAIAPDQEKALLDYVGRRRRVRPAPLRLVLLPQLADVRRPGRRPVQAPRHGRVRHQGRRPRPPDHEGPRAVPDLGRDLRPRPAQREGPPRPPGPRRGERRRALDLGPDPGQGARLLHRLRPRRPDLGPARLPRPGRARHPLGGEQGRGLRQPPAVAAGPEAVRVRRRRVADPHLPARQEVGHAGRADHADAAAARARPSRSSTWSCPAGFEARLFAAEPEIAKPICMAWDHRGRLWIAETTDYPNNLQPVGKGDDRIKICEDTDGDGQADKFTVFADKLSIPTSLAFANGGVIVHQAPDTLFLKDTDGDDKADVRKVLFTGWGTSDTHAGPSNLRYGLRQLGLGDRRLLGVQRARSAARRHEFSPGVLPVQARRLEARVPPEHEQQLLGRRLQRGGARLRLDGQRLPERLPADPEPLLRVGPRLVAERPGRASPTRTGSTRSPTRSARSTGTAASPPPPATPSTPRGPTRSTTGTAPRSSPSRPATSSPRSCSSRRGATSRSDNAWNLLASDDEWTSPIAAEVGPDGHVWVIDWYNYIVQHNPTPEGFKTGKGNAYETPLRDKTHGRIYRIVYNGRQARRSRTTLDPNDGRGARRRARRTTTMFWRMHAQRLLVERGKTDVVPALIELVDDRSVDAIGLNPAAIHALWTLHGLGALDGAGRRGRDGGGRRGAEAPLGGRPAERGRRSCRATRRRPTAILGRAAPDRPRPAGPPRGLPGPGRHARRRPRPPAAVVDALVRRRGRRRPLARRRRHRRRRGATPTAFLKALAARKLGKPAAAAAALRSSAGSPSTTPGAARPTRSAACSPRSADADPRGRRRRSSPAWPRAGPRTSPPTLDDGRREGARRPPAEALARGPRASSSSLGEPLGQQGPREARRPRSPRRSWPTARDEQAPDAARVDAARQLVEFRPTDAEAAAALLALITPADARPRWPPGLIDAVGRSESPEVGAGARRAAAGADARRSGPRPSAPCSAAPTGPRPSSTASRRASVRLDELSLDQKQALAAHPDQADRRAGPRPCSPGAAACPTPTARRSSTQLAPVVLKGGDAAKGKLVFTAAVRQVPHATAARGARSAPTSPGWPPTPRTSCSSTSSTRAGASRGTSSSTPSPPPTAGSFNGLLASETQDRRRADRRRGQDARRPPRGHRRADRLEEVADARGVREAGPARGDRRPARVPHPARQVPAARPPQGRPRSSARRGCSTSKDVAGRAADLPRLVAQDVRGRPVPARRPAGRPVPNAILLYGPNGDDPAEDAPVGQPARATPRRKAIHLLSGVSGWGFDRRPTPTRTISMIVRLHYADGTTEDHPLRERRPLRRLHPPHRRPRLEARLPAPRPADPLPRRPPRADRPDRVDRAGQGPRPDRAGRHGGDRRIARVTRRVPRGSVLRT